MTGAFEDDDLSHFTQEIQEWDPNLDLLPFVGEPHSPMDDGYAHDTSGKFLSPSMSPLPFMPVGVTAPETPAPPTPASFDPMPNMTGVTYNSATGHDYGVSEAPALKHTGEVCNPTSPMQSPMGDDLESSENDNNDVRPKSLGRVSMGVKAHRSNSNMFKCQWRGCDYSGGFSGVAALLRHIRTKHLCPGIFKCPDEECSKAFNRKDNLVAHMRNVHRGLV